MGMLVVQGAMLKCAFGQGGPVPLGVLRADATAGGRPVATIKDKEAMVNIPSFGMCVSPANPAVSGSGVLIPQPCLPEVIGAWVPGSPSVEVDGAPALTDASKCMCKWSGVIQILNAGQLTAEVAG